MGNQVRPPAVAGMFYPAQPAALRQMMQSYLDAVPPPALTAVQAVIAPHAGYIYSGPVAAYDYRLLAAQPMPPQRVLLLGPSHRAWFPGVALGDYDAFETPLGNVPVDRAYLQRLAAASKFFALLPQAHAAEHCLEVQLPFLQLIGLTAPIVPLLFGEVDARAVGEALEPLLEPGDLIVVSSDLSHYHPYEVAQSLDRTFLEAVVRGDRMAVAQGEACGEAPVVALMTIAARRGWQPHLLDYRNSGDTSGDRRQVVGYAAVAYTAA